MSPLLVELHGTHQEVVGSCREKQMKQEGRRGDHLVSIGSPTMTSGVSPNSVTQHPSPFPTPSPFSIPPSTRWSSAGPPLHILILVLRFLALVFSFISAVALASPSTTKAHDHEHDHESWYDPDHDQHLHHQNPPLNSELMYCLIVLVMVFFYSVLQLLKGVCDIVHSGMLISDKASDYMDFLLDQVAGYVVASGLSVGVVGAKGMEAWWRNKGVVISVSASAATFLVVVTCALLSGYKLCKRIIW